MGNSAVQFSGGRTSAYMLWRLLNEYPEDLRCSSSWKVMFENTGKEREETLEFIHQIETEWAIPVIWLEFDDSFDSTEYVKPDGSIRQKKLRSGVRYRIVNFKTASRYGEPFEKVIKWAAEYRAFAKEAPPILPNPAQRICTAYLKRKVCRSFLLDLAWDDWDIYMGIRKDEESRRSKMLAWLPSNECLRTPLISENIIKQDVNAFWRDQPFDLKLDPNSDEGNCDLCFLKATGKLIKIMRADRFREKWWIGMEEKTGTTFSRNKLSFTQIAAMIDADDEKLRKYEQYKVSIVFPDVTEMYEQDIPPTSL